MAILDGLMYECLSPDSMKLAIYRGRDTARAAGVPPEEFARVKEIVLARYRSRRSPLSCLF
jgi:hypothetical protein